MIRKQYVSVHAKCKEIPLKEGLPLDFEIGNIYSFAQIGRIFILYAPYRTNVRLGYKQFNKCFERI